MDKKTVGNHAAFPREVYITTPGLSKREYFAAIAMGGLMDPIDGLRAEDCAELAVAHADALIAKLNESNV